MKYQYYITYKYTNYDDSGDSAVCITMNNKMDSPEAIQAAVEQIESKYKNTTVLIQNFILLKEAK